MMAPLHPTDMVDGPEHDLLLLASTVAEAARLAPVAARLTQVGRIAPITVATGADPMRVHLVLDAMGAPAEVTLLLANPPHTRAGVAAALAERFETLITERDPSAVLVTGGSTASVLAAQIAFWNQIPVVYLEPGPRPALEQLDPFPIGGNRRVIGQLSSLVLRALEADPGIPSPVGGPNLITVGDTMARAPLTDPDLALLAERAMAGRIRIALVDGGVTVAVEAATELLASQPDLVVIVLGTPVGASVRMHQRLTILPECELSAMLGLLRVATVGITDHPGGYRESLGFGLPMLLVDHAGAVELPPGVLRADRAKVLAELTRLLAEHPDGAVRHTDDTAPIRAEHALAWMFGMEPEPAAVVPPPSVREPARRPRE